MSKSLDISMHPIFLLATRMVSRNLSDLHCATRGASSETWDCALSWPARTLGIVPGCHPCRVSLSAETVPCTVVISGSSGHEMTSTDHSDTKRTLIPPVALPIAVPGESELERSVQSRGFLGCYQIFCCAEIKDAASVSFSP